MDKGNELYVDGGIYNSTYYGQYGTGYAKVNFGNNRVEIQLPTNQNTSNEAEFFAVLCGITEGLARGFKKFTIYADSQLTVNVCNGKWKTKNSRFVLIASSINALLHHYDIQLEWKPREENLAT